jgi:hypothetical protein
MTIAVVTAALKMEDLTSAVKLEFVGSALIFTKTRLRAMTLTGEGIVYI